MSLNFTKLPYVDGETVIPASNLNAIQDAILDLDSNKVEKEPGKGLSTNDYSDTDKSKVDTALQATTPTTIGPAPIVTFDASAADMPLKGLTVNIEPVQSGSGDPSPENVRPISGWTGCKLLKTGQNLSCDTNYTNGTTAGVQYTKLSDGSYLATGIITSKSARYLIGGTWGRTFKPGKYQVSCDGVSSDGIRLTVAYVQRYGQSVKYIDITTPNVKSAFEIEPTGYIYSIYFRGETNGTTVNTILKPLLMFQVDTETGWVPYVGETYPITFPTEAGTVYGGTLDVTSGVLTVDRANLDLSTKTWTWYAANNWWTTTLPGAKKHNDNQAFNMLCSNSKVVAATAIGSESATCIALNSNKTLIYKNFDSANSPTGQLVYELATSIEITLTPTQIDTLLGANNIWADTGDVTVTYGAYLETVKAHAERLGDSILSAIAPLETTYTASRAYAVGEFLFVGTKFYKVTAAIAEGGTITPGTNAVQTTVAEQLMTLAVKPAILG